MYALYLASAMSLSKSISDDWDSVSALQTFYNVMVSEQRKVGPTCSRWFTYRRENVNELKLRIAYCLLERPPHVEQGIERLMDFLDSFTPQQRVIIEKAFKALSGLFRDEVETIEVSTRVGKQSDPASALVGKKLKFFESGRPIFVFFLQKNIFQRAYVLFG